MVLDFVRIFVNYSREFGLFISKLFYDLSWFNNLKHNQDYFLFKDKFYNQHKKLNELEVVKFLYRIFTKVVQQL